jgi:hypothetical protein
VVSPGNAWRRSRGDERTLKAAFNAIVRRSLFQDVLDDHGVPAVEQAELFTIVGGKKADIVTMQASSAKSPAP